MENSITSTEILQHGSRYGKLVFIDSLAVTRATRGKTKWKCDCGKECLKETGNVTRGTTKSCGKCLEITAEDMKERKFGKLRMKLPEAITTGSAKKIWWVCDCGKESFAVICGVISGSVKSCGHCNDILINTQTKYGKLTIAEQIELPPGSHKKVLWSCDCGKTTEVQARYVLSGVIKTCNKCNLLEGDVLKYNRLTLRDLISIKSGSNKKVWWKCDCGNESFAQAVAVVSGRTKSCGKCHITYRAKWLENQDKIRALRTPIQPENIPDCCPVALEVIQKVSEPFRARCRLCNGEYFPRWSGIRSGVSLTCGCSTSRVSSGQAQIYSFIKNELQISADLEHPVGNLVYDIFVSSQHLVIEFNGIKWHSRRDSKKRDLEKYKNALAHGKSFLMFFEDEWRDSPEKVKNFLRNRLSSDRPCSVRPSKTEIRQIHWKECDPIYDKFHYIGRAKAPINYGIFLDGELIGACSFKRPTRQSSHDWELIRMVMNPAYRVHGVFAKTIKRFLVDHNPKSIVSFSDNRLFSGEVYKHLGFKFDGKVPPDYYWAKSDKRYHKSGLRKTEAEKTTGKTEIELREAQGYNRIWDLGKKRWVYDHLSFSG